MKAEPFPTGIPQHSCVLMGVINKMQDEHLAKEYLDELAFLAETYGLETKNHEKAIREKGHSRKKVMEFLSKQKNKSAPARLRVLPKYKHCSQMHMCMQICAEKQIKKQNIGLRSKIK